MSASLTVVVHGATGTQGAPVARRMVEAGHRVRSAVRNPLADGLPAGVEPVLADLLDADALSRAYDGADAVVIQLPLEFAADRAVPQAEAVLAALGKAGVSRVMFNGGGPIALDPVGVPYLDARALLARELSNVVGTAAVVGPAGPYLENLSAPWSVARIRARGELVYPLPAQLSVPWLALDDLAAVIVDLLIEEAPPPHVVVAGPQGLTGDETAGEVSTALGRPISWVTISPSELGQMLAPYLGNQAAAGVAALYAGLADAPPPSAPETAIVRSGTTNLGRWVRRQDWSAAR